MDVTSWQLLDVQLPDSYWNGEPFFWINDTVAMYAYTEPGRGWLFEQMAGPPYKRTGGFEQKDGWLRAYTHSDLPPHGICGACGAAKAFDADYLCERCRDR
jgi:hypothetical protein